MDRYQWPYSALTLDLLTGLFLAIIMDRHERSYAALIIAFLRSIYLAIIMTVIKVTIFPLI
jgi:hypothetical protein